MQRNEARDDGGKRDEARIGARVHQIIVIVVSPCVVVFFFVYP